VNRGPKTAEGRARCAAAKTVHGRETRAIRRERGIKSAELLLLEELMVKLGMLKGGKTRGRKPNAYLAAKKRAWGVL
jgi:hypothetical protein